MYGNAVFRGATVDKTINWKTRAELRVIKQSFDAQASASTKKHVAIITNDDTDTHAESPKQYMKEVRIDTDVPFPSVSMHVTMTAG